MVMIMVMIMVIHLVSAQSHGLQKKVANSVYLYPLKRDDKKESAESNPPKREPLKREILTKRAMSNTELA